MNNNTDIDLSKSKQFLDVLIDLVPGIVYIYNQKGEKICWNKMTEDIIGHINDDIADSNEIDVLFPDTQKQSIIDKAFKDGELNMVTEVTTKNGEQKIYSHVGVISNINNEKYLIGTGIDITEKIIIEKQQRVNQYKVLKLISKIGSIEDQEKRKIANWIHDEIGQELSILHMKLTWETSGEIETSTRQKETTVAIKYCIDTLRSLIFELTPPVLNNHDLIQGLNHLVEYFDYKHQKIIHLYINNLETLTLSEETINLVYTGIRELIMNAHKYAGTDEIWVSLLSNKETIEISVIDHGIGFIPEQINYTKTFGIFNLKERITLVGGNFNIKSSSGNGTQIEFSLPIL